MRGSGPQGAGRWRPPGGGCDPPSTPASLAGCYSAPRRAPLWTCLLLCAALRTLLASPSNEGRVRRRLPRRRGRAGEAGPGSEARGAVGAAATDEVSFLVSNSHVSWAFASLSLCLSAVCGCIVWHVMQVLDEEPACAQRLFGGAGELARLRKGSETGARSLGAAGAN